MRTILTNGPGREREHLFGRQGIPPRGTRARVVTRSSSPALMGAPCRPFGVLWGLDGGGVQTGWLLGLSSRRENTGFEHTWTVREFTGSAP